MKQNNIGSKWIGLKDKYRSGLHMPRYDFKNLKTGEVKEYTMSWKDLDQFKKDNPDLQQQIGVINNIGETKSKLTKAGDGWKEVQQRIQSGMPPRLRGNIKTK
jgi:hypothetical protein